VAYTLPQNRRVRCRLNEVPVFPYTELLLETVQRFPAGTRWAVACGSALALHRLEYCPTDLDFFAPYDDMQRIAHELDGMQVVFPLEWRSIDFFCSYFGRYDVDGVKVDFVGDFSISVDGTWYEWNGAHPCWTHLEQVRINEVSVPVYSLEDLLLLYLTLPHEDAKLALITHALRSRGIDRAYLKVVIAKWPKLAGPMERVLASG